MNSTLKIPANRLTLSNENVVKFQSSNFDLAVRAGFGILDSTFFNVCKNGIISLHLGDSRKVRGSMPGFYESLFKHDEIGFIIQKINDKLDGGEVIFRANYPAKSRWNDNHLFIIGLSFEIYYKTILNLLNNNISYFEVGQPYFAKLNIAPSLYTTLKYIYILLKDTFLNNWIFYFGKNPCWHVHFINGDWNSAFFYKSKVIQNNLNSFFADPFPVKINEVVYLFVEEYLYPTRKGVISLLKYENSEFKYIGIVLDLPFHLSFPFIYQENDEIYMIPEQAHSNLIGLYKATDFPLKWELHKVLLEDVDAADTILIKIENVYWLFTNIDRTQTKIHSSELHIFYNYELNTNWLPHPQNSTQKICSFGKRNASEIFQKNGKLYRFGQIQGNSFYGRGIALFEIKINENEYSEILINDFYPDFSSKIKGLHHISSTGDLTFIDCYY